jgi:multiple sugar transport system ATP-binding protein
MAELRLESVTKKYDSEIYGAHDITFDIKDKEFTVLVGPSGCGKTTTLRLIAGLEACDSGKIFINGSCVNDVSPKDRDVAMVFQNYALYPHMSVYDNMAFGLRMRRYPKKEINARVMEAAQILGISELLQRKPRHLSGGQRQRVAVGRAIVRQPKVFLFDEPLSNLDAKLRVQMRAELSRLHRKFEATIVYVTHDQVEAMTLGEKIVVINEAHVQQVADPSSLYQHPKNRFVAGFIGSPPMNFITGIIRKRQGDITFHSADVNIGLSKKFEHCTNREVILGIRPTDFSRTRGSKINIVVDVVEPMGNEFYIHGRCGTTMLSARLPDGMQTTIGSVVALAIDPKKIYRFDAHTEENLI